MKKTKIISLSIFGILALLFPIFLGLWFTIIQQLIWGFDDMPVIAMILGFICGIILNVLLFSITLRLKKQFIVCILIIIFAIIEILTIPVCRYLTQNIIEK
jgi:hypothetical protein